MVAAGVKIVLSRVCRLGGLGLWASLLSVLVRVQQPEAPPTRKEYRQEHPTTIF